MKALVVYESFWGHTAEIAHAIAEGIGNNAKALPTSEATADVVSGLELIVAGAPLLGFTLANEEMRQSIAGQYHPTNPDFSNQLMKDWLKSLPKGSCAVAAFETGIWWSPGSAAKKIMKALKALGYKEICKPERFVVKGKYGPLGEGEIERAKHWGANLIKR